MASFGFERSIYGLSFVIIYMCVHQTNCTRIETTTDSQHNSNFHPECLPRHNCACSNVQICHCLCQTSCTMVANCSNLNLNEFPKFHQNVSEVYLQNNNLTKFGHNGELPTNLTYLDVSGNKFDFFNDNPFENMTKLEHLDLNGNNLEYSEEIFTEDVFKSMQSLKYLNIKQNNKRNGGNVTYPTSISYLEKLETLLLDGLYQTSFGKEFGSLRHLESLDMAGIYDFCNISVIKQDTFQHVPFIQNLNVSNCNLRHIDQGSFILQTRLMSLNISNNIFLTFKVLANVTSDLTSTQIDVLDVSRLHCTYGTGISVYREDIQHLNSTNLTQLYVDSNRLVGFQYGVLHLLPRTVQYISLRGNRLTFGCYFWEISSMENIEVTDARDQYTSHNPLTSLTSLDCNDWRAPPSNHLTHCSLQTMSSLIDIRLPPKLNKVIFSNSGLTYQIPNLSFAKNNMSHIEMQGNLLTSWKGPILNLQTVRYVDLSNNFCSYLSVNFFRYTVNVEVLLLQNNLLGFTLNKYTNKMVFEHLLNLKFLNMSSNHIKTIPKRLLYTQNKLENLSLSSNILYRFDLEISHLKTLRHLDLSNNQLQTITKEQREQIDALKGNLLINLQGNILQCSCKNLEFLSWLESNKNIFQNFKKYKCSMPGASDIISFEIFHKTLVKLRMDCGSYIGLIIGSTCAIVMSISLLISGVVYRYRWKLRYMYYLARSKRHGYQHLPTEEDDERYYDYDAFISYCSDDRRFDKMKCEDYLEKQHNFRICLHERDFIPGTAIAENITSAIHRSRKMIVVLSNMYLKSKWCMYEFEMAKVESISREGNSMLILVLYENVAPKDLPLTLSNLIKNQTYIEYPNDIENEENVVFWDNLARAIT